jgi:small subunit ribosomal protein S1
LLKETGMGQAAESPEHPMNFLLEDDIDVGFPQSGDIRFGEVVAHRKHEILVDIGAKSEGIISGAEMAEMDDEIREQLAIGNTVPVYILNPDDEDGNIVLSYVKALEEDDWQQAHDLLESQEALESRIVGFNRGGVLVRVGRIRGFIPASQLGYDRRVRAQSAREDRLRELVGEPVTARVIEVDRSRNRLILSERAAMKEIRSAQRARVLTELEEGEIRTGRVVNLADFGAFVDIGGIEGLVHVSELSWKRVTHPNEAVRVGDRVEVYVLGVDMERERVALSVKRLQPDPWTIVDTIYQEGDLVEATVTKLTKYGAFARIEDEYGLEGLIHISEMAEDRIEHPQEVVQKGETVTARVIRVDPDQRQLGLSMKQVSSAEFLETDLALAEDAESD